MENKSGSKSWCEHQNTGLKKKKKKSMMKKIPLISFYDWRKGLQSLSDLGSNTLVSDN